MSSELHPAIARVTERIVERSRDSRRRYLDLMEREGAARGDRNFLSCSNLAHGFAAALEDKPVIAGMRAPNLGIVTAYNDMLSAHQPYGRYPEAMKLYAREVGATAQVAGGVPAMCDGVTQGQVGMELSLLSRDTIALGTAVALSHAMFDGMALLGICDKIVPGLLIGALRFGHLPAIFVPSGPMPSGLANKEKQKVRQLYAEGKASRADLLASESASYHSPGTCTFYGTANSNQMMMELMGAPCSRRGFRHPQHPAALGADPGGGASARGDRQGRRRSPTAGAGGRRKGDRQRLRRPARDGRIDQPRDPPAGDGAGCGRAHRLDRP
jgi:phosphogluconate dehydratase